MSVRVSESEVREIIETHKTTSQVESYIVTANLVVNARLGGEDLSEELLKEIEKWLSAHMICADDPRTKREAVGPVDVSYQLYTGSGLDSTSFGQRVKLLDTTGLINAAVKEDASLQAVYNEPPTYPAFI